jgi:hypothetical protein
MKKKPMFVFAGSLLGDLSTSRKLRKPGRKPWTPGDVSKAKPELVVMLPDNVVPAPRPNIRTKDGGVLQIIGRAENACLNFHCGNRPEYNLIDNSAELRRFFRMALTRLKIKRKR